MSKTQLHSAIKKMVNGIISMDVKACQCAGLIYQPKRPAKPETKDQH